MDSVSHLGEEPRGLPAPRAREWAQAYLPALAPTLVQLRLG